MLPLEPLAGRQKSIPHAENQRAILFVFYFFAHARYGIINTNGRKLFISLDIMPQDQERIQSLYKEIAPRLTNHLVASGQGYAAACDVVQETFLRIWKMRDQLRNDDSQVSGLAFTIAKNLVREHFRKDSRMTLQAEITDGEAGVVEPVVERQSDTGELRRRLQEAFAALPPLLREAYSMFQIMGLPIAEIARRTNVSESNVKVRIFRAKEKLRPLLKDLL